MLKYIYNDCVYDTGNLDWLIYRKEGKIIEQPLTDFDGYYKAQVIRDKYIKKHEKTLKKRWNKEMK